jgi:hypothetical protein
MSDGTLVPARYVWVAGLPSRNKMPCVRHVLGDGSEMSILMVVTESLMVDLTFEVVQDDHSIADRRRHHNDWRFTLP